MDNRSATIRFGFSGHRKVCGLFGFVRYTDWDVNDARNALDVLQHRGPDDAGEWRDDRVYIGHRRLSIIDTSHAASQPMVAGQVVMAANGEVYNFADLRTELSKRFEFRSHSDSEVLLHGYRAWGIEGLMSRIDGMYAFVLYDQEQGRLFLARDRVGIKPLYYADLPEGLIWASELKAIREFLRPSAASVDTTALYDFLTYNYIPSPKTMYRGIRKLEAAHYLEYRISTGSHSLRRYWQLSTETTPEKPLVAVDRIREAINTSVRSHLVSDVPLGCFLSGGLDSTIVATEASKVLNAVQTFCVSFSEATHDESRFAQIVADTLKTVHGCRSFPSENIGALVSASSDWYDEPFADLSSWPTFVLSEFARERVTVALSGDGGDEIFGGYARYNRFVRYRNIPAFVAQLLKRSLSNPVRHLNLSRPLHRLVRRTVEPRLLDDLELYVRLMSGLLRHEKTHYAAKWEIPGDYDDYWHFRRFYRVDLPPVTRLQYLDFNTYLPDDILTKVDRASMAVSLEVRVPFLSREIIEYTYSLPERIRFPGSEPKGLLRTAYGKSLPLEVLERPKKGFSIPSGRYLAPLSFPGESAQELILRRHTILNSLGFA